jgi:hypothetical protein
MDELPNELLVEIVKRLELENTLSLSQTSKRHYALAKDLLRREFKHPWLTYVFDNFDTFYKYVSETSLDELRNKDLFKGEEKRRLSKIFTSWTQIAFFVWMRGGYLLDYNDFSERELIAALKYHINMKSQQSANGFINELYVNGMDFYDFMMIDEQGFFRDERLVQDKRLKLDEDFLDFRDKYEEELEEDNYDAITLQYLHEKYGDFTRDVLLRYLKFTNETYKKDPIRLGFVPRIFRESLDNKSIKKLFQWFNIELRGSEFEDYTKAYEELERKYDDIIDEMSIVSGGYEKVLR